VLIALPKAVEPVGGKTTIVCDTWPVQRQTYGYLPNRKASPPIGWYQIILHGDRGTCVNNMPRVALDCGEVRIRTRDLLIASPNHSATVLRYG